MINLVATGVIASSIRNRPLFVKVTAAMASSTSQKMNSVLASSHSSSSLGLSCEGEDEIAMFPLTVDEIKLNTQYVDSIVAKEMSSLAIEDLETVYNDVHCVTSDIPETAELKRKCLFQLQQELSRITDKPAYNLAQSMDAPYVENDNFRLQFLRTDKMDPALAAGRLVRHFQAKLELFGKDLLAKDVTQDDLDEETMTALYDGSAQVLPIRDRADRLIIASLLHSASISIKAKLRRVFYITMVNAEDEETQRKGCVGISYLVGDEFSFSELAHRNSWNSKVPVLWNALPIRFEALHFCHDSFAWKTLFAVVKIASTMFTRIRVREHYGNQSECLIHLQTFGIPIDAFPIGNDGTRSTDTHVDKWTKRRLLERLRNQEDQNHQQEHNTKSIEEPVVRVQVPGQSDVLLGRGRPCYHHIGNIRLRKLIELRSQEYDVASYAEKQRITNEILSLIHKSMGRFLKDDGSGWSEVQRTVAKKKVAHAFRTLRSSRKGGRDSS